MQVDDQMHAGATHTVAHGEMPFAPLGRRGLDHGDMSDVLAGGAWVRQALPRSQEGVLAHWRPPQPRDPTECRQAASGKRMPPISPYAWTDHSGLPPHKAQTPGVKKILRSRGGETPSSGHTTSHTRRALPRVVPGGQL